MVLSSTRVKNGRKSGRGASWLGEGYGGWSSAGARCGGDSADWAWDDRGGVVVGPGADMSTLWVGRMVHRAPVDLSFTIYTVQ